MVGGGAGASEGSLESKGEYEGRGMLASGMSSL